MPLLQDKLAVSRVKEIYVPFGSIMATGSPIILTFCTKCGEAASIKVAKPEKFK
ncbi:hypothetical protein AABM34_10285 [Lysinibacillus fusiformis]